MERTPATPTEAGRPTPGWPGRFFRGARAPWEGLRYMTRNPGLWRHGIWPVVLNLFITAFVLVLFLGGVAGVMVVIDSWFSPTWGGRVLEVLTAIALVVLALAGAFVVWQLLQGMLCSYFYARLAREVEVRLGFDPGEVSGEYLSWTYQVLDGLRAAGKLLAINLGLFALNFVPVVGSLLAVCLAYYFDSWILGKEFFEFPLEVRGVPRAERRDFHAAHRPEVLGLGTTVLLCGLIPLVSSVLLTTAVVGAVLLRREVKGGT
jgi:uncharacterized protein involved in cysteine biosynthesis